jgi:CHAD domain-containing protein
MSKADRVEREAKFQLSPDQQPADFAEILAQDGYTVRSLGTVDLTDSYLDTPSFTLLRHGLTLRVRHGLAAYEVGIKALEGERKGASLARLDIAFPLPADAEPLDATTWPAAIFDALARMMEVKPKKVKPKELQPVVVLHQTRAKSHVQPAATGENATWAAEWSQDEVWIGGVGEGTTSHGPNAKGTPVATTASNGMDSALPPHFHELEVELLPAGGQVDSQNGDVEQSEADAESAAFDQFVASVQAQFDLTTIVDSKFVRGLAQMVAQAHGGADRIAPTMTLAGAGRLLLHQQLLQILLNEHGVREGKKASYVHEMRIAIRRARAALHLCATAFPIETVKSLGKGLKRLGRVLGAVRDLDVALANMRAFARRQPEGARQSFKRLRTELKTRRRHARTELFTFLDNKKYRKFIKEFAHFCATPTPDDTSSGDKHKVTCTQVRHTVPSSMWAAFEALRAYEVAFEQEATPPLESLHALRIETKYLRYLIEFTQHLLGRDGELLSEQLRALQEHLGEVNDAHVEDQRLLAWDAHIEGTHIGEVEALHSAIASRRAELAGRVAELSQKVPFADFAALGNRRRLARALAAI